jgi:hypothetical protein
MKQEHEVETSNPDVGVELTSESSWARSARISLWSFLTAVAFLILGLAILCAGIGSSWMSISFDEPNATIGGLCVFVAFLSIPISIISGLIAAPRRPVVLLWVIPLLLLIGWFVSSIM